MEEKNFNATKSSHSTKRTQKTAIEHLKKVEKLAMKTTSPWIERASLKVKKNW